jgi:hypothetical protein
MTGEGHDGAGDGQAPEHGRPSKQEGDDQDIEPEEEHGRRCQPSQQHRAAGCDEACGTQGDRSYAVWEAGQKPQRDDRAIAAHHGDKGRMADIHEAEGERANRDANGDDPAKDGGPVRQREEEVLAPGKGVTPRALLHCGIVS